MDNYVDHINGIPLTTRGDGDCLFNAVSNLLCGYETMFVKLKYLTCINLDSSVIGEFSNAWTFITLADAINMKIRVIYPYANGANDIACNTLNTKFKTYGNFDNRHQLAWYESGDVPTPGPGKWYTVNHFAAVIHVVHMIAYQ
ncbi:hypothetical protein ACJMK2_040653 [Sinanodonta woodiana]|uniref:OTU domain-containing protein n=1 Tax=Sinanodonta woodiana TaxID=1069815 RepID=A0ABD3W328_SINWO